LKKNCLFFKKEFEIVDFIFVFFSKNILKLFFKF